MTVALEGTPRDAKRSVSGSYSGKAMVEQNRSSESG